MSPRSVQASANMLGAGENNARTLDPEAQPPRTHRGGWEASTSVRPKRDRDELARLARRAAEELEGASAQDLLCWASAAAGDRFCVMSSMQDLTVVHLASRVIPEVQVVFVDTGFHFAETLEMARLAATTLPIRLISLESELTVEAQAQCLGPELFLRDPNRCCSPAAAS